MKKHINLILSVSFLIFLGLIIWINYLIKNDVGDINFDGSIDRSDFKICNEDRIFQYYSAKTSYIGERKAIRETILNYLKSENIEFDKKSGYITFRFIVNCEGQSGRYRFKAVDEKLLKTTFSASKVEKLKNAIMKLSKWKAGAIEDGILVDSYYQISFKIIDGKIVDIF